MNAATASYRPLRRPATLASAGGIALHPGHAPTDRRRGPLPRERP